jgi:hypothetical protein
MGQYMVFIIVFYLVLFNFDIVLILFQAFEMASRFLDQSAAFRQQQQQQQRAHPTRPTRTSSAPVAQDVFKTPPPATPTPPHIVGISRAPSYTTLTAVCQENFTHLLGAGFQSIAATIESNDPFVHQTTPTNSALNTPSFTAFTPHRQGNLQSELNFTNMFDIQDSVNQQ